MSVVIWLCIAIGVIVVDLLTSSFIFMWYSIGAIVALILSAIGATVTTQIISFLLVGTLTVCIGYPIVVKKFKASQKSIPTMEEGYIGMEITAVKEIVQKEQIMLNGTYWTVYNKGEKINIGNRFIITGIEGNKLIVKLKEEKL